MPVRLPVLLDADLTEKRRLHPTSGSVTPPRLTGGGEASLTLEEDEAEIAVHDWLALYTQRGLAGYYRVTNVADAVHKQVDVTMLHGIDILSDSVWPEQRDFSGTVAEFLAALLSHQTSLIKGVQPWRLGVCEDDRDYKAKASINYDNLLSLLEGLEEDGADYRFVYDQSSFPWTLSRVRLPEVPETEFRLTRNTRSATVTYNDADLCTRLHLSVNVKTEDSATGTSENNAVIRTYNNETAQARYGIVVKTADIDTQDDIENELFPEADAWAGKFLAQRREPSVQIQIEGDELAELTGDTWDEMDVGKLCRVALPSYGKSYLERVVSVTYPDPWGDPSRVTVSLANSLPRFSETLTDVRKTAARAARSVRRIGRSATTEKEKRFWKENVEYIGKALDGTGVTTLYRAGIDMDAAGGVKIFSLEQGLQALYSGITVNAHKIELQVQESANLSSRITQTARSIEQIVTEVGADGTVTTASIVTAINNHKSSIKLNADTINLEGYVTATMLDTAIAAIDSIVGDLDIHGSLTVGGNTYLSAAYVPENDGLNHLVASRYYVENYVDGYVEDAVNAFGTPTASGGQISIPYTTIGGGSGSINFNIADTQYYQDGVSAARAGVTMSAGGWLYNSEEGELTNYIIATNGQSLEISQPTVSISVSGGYAYAYVHDKNGGRHTAARVEVSSGGIRSSSLTGSSNSSSDMSTWQSDADNTLSLSARYGLITVIPNSGSAYDIAVNALGTYNAGWNGLIAAANGSGASSYVQYSGKSGYNASLTRSGKTITGYIWLKNASGTWVRTREISIQAATTTARVYYIDNDGDYVQYPAGKVIYTW